MLCQRVPCLQDHLGDCSWGSTDMQEGANSADRYAVVGTQGGNDYWTLTTEDVESSLFLRRGGSIRCKVTGSRHYSSDLPQGGLKIPCSLLFKANVP